MSAAETLLDRQADAIADRQMPAGKLIRLADVPRLKWLPGRRGGTRLAIPTLHRWADPNRQIHLRTVRVGGCRCTTEDWLREFFVALSDGASTNPPARSHPRPPRP